MLVMPGLSRHPPRNKAGISWLRGRPRHKAGVTWKMANIFWQVALGVLGRMGRAPVGKAAVARAASGPAAVWGDTLRVPAISFG